jgi:phosphoserine phosphatase
VKALTAQAIIDRIAPMVGRAAGPADPAAVAFDGDGTLWSGDIGDDFFHATEAADRYAPDVVDAMRDLGRASGLEGVDRDAGVAIARRLFDGYIHHTVPEDRMCEVIAWSCAGWREAEVVALARTVIRETGLEGRLHRAVGTVVDWARGHGVEAFLVSASPRPVVEAAGELLGFDRDHVLATTAPFEDGVMTRDVVRPIPYGPGKATLLADRLRGRRLVAAFGDNVFDVPMLRAAELGVVVEPKPRLVAHLAAIAADWEPVRLDLT